MNTKFFGQFLLEKGIINREQLLEALDAQRKSAPLLGDIAIEKEWITAQQAARINTEQRRQDKRFGEIAISLALLDDSQIGVLLSEQKFRRQYFGEILAELGYISRDDLDTQLAKHRQYNDEFAAHIDTSFEDSALGTKARAVSELFSRFYQRMMKTSISITDVFNTLPENKQGDLFWTQTIQSDKTYHLTLSLNKEHACLIASNFLDMTIDELDELSIDAVCEFLNTFLGHAYIKISNDTMPRIQPPQHHAALTNMPISVCTTLMFDSGKFAIGVSISIAE
ncbi:hypothetical protein [Marinomonas mediterranea]|uniref:hypothetical protein n=1 Tax=Marinomonas mediterranea TaxID=119864 RepID=UPI00234B4BA5|nr:hypothetical protein [Marinomonas mediterranea]WCN07819.1 hypothetical protein GV055_02200 [Marinomonas mediterranea]